MTSRRLPIALSLSCALLALGSTAVCAQSAPGSLAELSAVQSVSPPSVSPPSVSQVPTHLPAPGVLPGVPAGSVPPNQAPAAPARPETGRVVVGGLETGGMEAGGTPQSLPPQVTPAPGFPPVSPTAGPQAGAALGAPPTGSDSGVALPPLSASAQSLIQAQDTTDESTLLRVVGRGQARLALMDLASKLETDRMKMETARLEFAKKKREAAKDAGDAGGAASPSSGGTSGAALPAAPVVPAFEPSVRSIFSFGASAVAQVFVAPGASVPVQTGDVLPDGTKVVLVSANAVTVRRPGAHKTSVLPHATAADGALSGPVSSAGAPSSVSTAHPAQSSAPMMTAPMPPAPTVPRPPQVSQP